MMNSKYKVLLNEVNYLNCKCSVFYPDIHDFELFNTVYDVLKSDILDKYRVFSVSVQKSLFSDEDFVTIWLE